MTFLKLVINLWRICQNPTSYDKGIICHLSVNPGKRVAVTEWHTAQKITGTECEK